MFFNAFKITCSLICTIYSILYFKFIQYFALSVQALSRTINMLKMLLINIIIILYGHVYIFFRIGKKTIQLLMLLEVDLRCPFRSRNFLIKINKKLQLYGVQQTVLPPMIVLPSVSPLPLVSFVMFSDGGGTGRCPFCRQSSGFN